MTLLIWIVFFVLPLAILSAGATWVVSRLFRDLGSVVRIGKGGSLWA